MEFIYSFSFLPFLQILKFKLHNKNNKRHKKGHIVRKCSSVPSEHRGVKLPVLNLGFLEGCSDLVV